MTAELAGIDTFRTLVFDCDGVVLDSNKVKTQAFYSAALPYGEDAAQALVDYHVEWGGVSRYRKFEWFTREVVKGRIGPGIDSLLQSYAAQVRAGLLSCREAPGLRALRERTSGARWIIVSGGDQIELREIFRQRGLAKLFDGGIFGSPDAKEDILSRELASENIISPALFIGDSKYDHIAASGAGISFVFLSEWSEFSNWPHYCENNNIDVLSNLTELV